MKSHIEALEEEMELLSQDLEAADAECENLSNKLQELQEKAKRGLFFSKKVVLAEIKKILLRSVHTVNLTVPTIFDIRELDLYDLKASINIKVATWVDLTNDEHKEIFDELQFDNIVIRSDDQQDRFCILRDGEELFFGIVGKTDDKLLTFYTNDSKHIKLLSSLVIESWLRSRKIEKDL